MAFNRFPILFRFACFFRHGFLTFICIHFIGSIITAAILNSIIFSVANEQHCTIVNMHEEYTDILKPIYVVVVHRNIRMFRFIKLMHLIDKIEYELTNLMIACDIVSVDMFGICLTCYCCRHASFFFSSWVLKKNDWKVQSIIEMDILIGDIDHWSLVNALCHSTIAIFNENVSLTQSVVSAKKMYFLSSSLIKLPRSTV